MARVMYRMQQDYPFASPIDFEFTISTYNNLYEQYQINPTIENSPPEIQPRYFQPQPPFEFNSPQPPSTSYHEQTPLSTPPPSSQETPQSTPQQTSQQTPQQTPQPLPFPPMTVYVAKDSLTDKEKEVPTLQEGISFQDFLIWRRDTRETLSLIDNFLLEMLDRPRIEITFNSHLSNIEVDHLYRVRSPSS